MLKLGDADSCCPRHHRDRQVSALANTEGGELFLGIDEDRKSGDKPVDKRLEHTMRAAVIRPKSDFHEKHALPKTFDPAAWRRWNNNESQTDLPRIATTDKGWSIIVPSANVLNAASKAKAIEELKIINPVMQQRLLAQKMR